MPHATTTGSDRSAEEAEIARLGKEIGEGVMPRSSECAAPDHPKGEHPTCSQWCGCRCHGVENAQTAGTGC